MSASALTCTGITPPRQSGPDELTDARASPRGTAGEAPEKPRRPRVQPALVLDVGRARVAGCTQAFGDDFLQELGDAPTRLAGGLLQAGLHRGRDAPCVDFGLSSHCTTV